jgi:IMP dehydrogenase
MRNIRKALSFDDILIEPHFSKVHPSKVDLTSKVGGRVLHFPVFSAAMDTLTGLEMAQAIGDYGGCGIIHKNMSIGEQSDLAHALLKYKYSKERPFTFGAAIGVGDMDRLLSLYKHNPDFIVIDAAHGHTQAMIDFFKEIQHKLDFTFDPGNFIVGNVTTVGRCERSLQSRCTNHQDRSRLGFHLFDESSSRYRSPSIPSSDRYP